VPSARGATQTQYAIVGDLTKETDEAFIVIDGDLRIDFRDGAVRVAAGEMV
jgi:mannose-6-phosphate isomerase-like protein (cupin superfamily)